MSTDLSSPSSQAPRPDPENLTLEDLRKNPLVLKFAGVDEEIALHHPTIGFFSDLCKKICESGPK